MPYPFLRGDERTAGNRPDPHRVEVGVRILYANGVRHWFPAPSPQLAWVLIRAAVPENLLEDVHTVIEYGQRCGTAFTRLELLKGGPTDATDPQQQ